MLTSATLPYRDQRQFALYDYRHGHGFAHFRGFPDVDSEISEPALDLVFRFVTRICCARDFSPLHLRVASAAEAEVISRRVGPIGSRHRVFLLENETIESYVVAGQLTAAEFSIGGGAESPLTSESREYIAANPALSGLFELFGG